MCWFRSTGNIDRAVLEAKKEQTSGGRFKHVKAHMIYVVVVTATLIYRIHDAIKYKECRSVLIVLGLTLFHITLCAHMLVPIIFIAFPTSHFKSEDRKKLLSYMMLMEFPNTHLPQLQNPLGCPQCSSTSFCFMQISSSGLQFCTLQGIWKPLIKHFWVYVNLRPCPDDQF